MTFTRSVSTLARLVGPAAEAPQFQISRWVFLRLLGVTYLLAFASLAPQIVGLIGTDGLLPLGQYLDRAREFYGPRAYFLLPTITWISASDVALKTLCWAGIALSGCAIVGIAPVPTFAGLWALYLSLTVAGQTFLNFQWDVLLLETGLLACLYAPLGWTRRTTMKRPPDSIRWLIWGLAFKLTFLSGITKLVSGDQTWRGLTALTFHYQTQPIPAWTSWFAHHTPDWLLTTSVAVMFFIELIVSFLIFVPTRWRALRAAACMLMCSLQVAIGVTGNYGFFNVLTVVLYLTLLDDLHISRLLPRSVAARLHASIQRVREPRPWRVVVMGLAVVIAFMSTLTLWRESTYTRSHPAWSNRLLSWVAPTRSINGYGLFRTMTTERPEIVVEGTLDGVAWTEYAFRWKPGAVSRRPGFVQPHMPRLDWLMWFAALDPYDHQHWLATLMDRLLAGSPAVLALLDDNPFPDSPPILVRLALYRYEFATPAQSERTGDWWRREFVSYLTEPVPRR